MKNSYPIRLYLFLLVLGAILPFVVLHIYLSYQNMRQRLAATDSTLAMLTHIAAGVTQHFLYDGEIALQRISDHKAIRSLQTKQCEDALRLFTCVNPNFCSISVVTVKGKLVCSESGAMTNRIDVRTDMQWLNEVMTKKTFIVSGPIMDRSTSRYVVILGYPIYGPHANLTGAVAIAIDLLEYDSVHFTSAMENAGLPPGSVVTIVDTMGNVLARWPNAKQWVGHKVNDSEIFRRIQAQPKSQMIQAHGMNGVEKLYRYISIPQTNWTLYVGIPMSMIVTPSRQAMYHSIMLGAGVLVLALLVAGYLSGLIRRPLRHLSGVVTATIHGDKDQRVLVQGPREFAEFSEHFNDMLIALARSDAALAKEKEQAEITLASIGDAVIRTDANGLITYLNPMAEQLTGWYFAQAKERWLFDVVKLVDSVSHVPIQRTLDEAIKLGYLVNVADSTVLIRRDGRHIPVSDCAAPLRDRQGNLLGTVLVFRDISRTRELSAQLSWQATHDSLTGLYNRHEFERRLLEALRSAREEGRQHAIMYLDLDQFKIVNDTSGHSAGDDLLRHLTSLLQSEVREQDTLARLGGDEFGVLLENCPLDQALRIADQFRETIQGFRFVWQDKTFLIGVSIGVAPVKHDSESLTQILSAVDAACYAAKEKGRNRVHVFDQDDVDLVHRIGEMHWVQRITDAFEQDRFRLYCQTIQPLHSNGSPKIWGEILLRLIDEDGQLLLPDAFLPAAERYNLMPTVDRWVVRTLFAQLSSESRYSMSDYLYSVNISGAALSDELFLDFVIEQFTQSKLPPEVICFEITETMAIINLPQATRFVTVLKNMGCSVALDDFGSGISSFGYLKTIPVDYLKIDGHFVVNIERDPMHAAMVEAMNKVGHIMGIKTVAEFVENEIIAAQLNRLGVDFAQGFGIGRPIALDAWQARI
jgi:diguanylate cyclase (GGDEF)-like protein/PAS domain S-box-containing protein